MPKIGLSRKAKARQRAAASRLQLEMYSLSSVFELPINWRTSASQKFCFNNVFVIQYRAKLYRINWFLNMNSQIANILTLFFIFLSHGSTWFSYRQIGLLQDEPNSLAQKLVIFQFFSCLRKIQFFLWLYKIFLCFVLLEVNTSFRSNRSLISTISKLLYILWFSRCDCSVPNFFRNLMLNEWLKFQTAGCKMEKFMIEFLIESKKTTFWLNLARYCIFMYSKLPLLGFSV